MPRIEMALVPELSIETPGVKRAMSWKSLIPRMSMSSWVSAVTLIGTLLSASSWRVAVTTTSCSSACSALSVAAGAAVAPAALAASACALRSGAPSRPVAANDTTTPKRRLRVACIMFVSFPLNAAAGTAPPL